MELMSVVKSDTTENSSVFDCCASRLWQPVINRSAVWFPDSGFNMSNGEGKKNLQGLKSSANHGFFFSCLFSVGRSRGLTWNTWSLASVWTQRWPWTEWTRPRCWWSVPVNCLHTHRGGRCPSPDPSLPCSSYLTSLTFQLLPPSEQGDCEGPAWLMVSGSGEFWFQRRRVFVNSTFSRQWNQEHLKALNRPETSESEKHKWENASSLRVSV